MLIELVQNCDNNHQAVKLAEFNVLDKDALKAATSLIKMQWKIELEAAAISDIDHESHIEVDGFDLGYEQISCWGGFKDWLEEKGVM